MPISAGFHQVTSKEKADGGFPCCLSFPARHSRRNSSFYLVNKRGKPCPRGTRGCPSSQYTPMGLGRVGRVASGSTVLLNLWKQHAEEFRESSSVLASNSSPYRSRGATKFRVQIHSATARETTAIPGNLNRSLVLLYNNLCDECCKTICYRGMNYSRARIPFPPV